MFQAIPVSNSWTSFRLSVLEAPPNTTTLSGHDVGINDECSYLGNSPWNSDFLHLKVPLIYMEIHMNQSDKKIANKSFLEMKQCIQKHCTVISIAASTYLTIAPFSQTASLTCH